MRGRSEAEGRRPGAGRRSPPGMALGETAGRRLPPHDAAAPLTKPTGRQETRHLTHKRPDYGSPVTHATQPRESSDPPARARHPRRPQGRNVECAAYAPVPAAETPGHRSPPLRPADPATGPPGRLDPAARKRPDGRQGPTAPRTVPGTRRRPGRLRKGPRRPTAPRLPGDVRPGRRRAPLRKDPPWNSATTASCAPCAASPWTAAPCG